MMDCVLAKRCSKSVFICLRLLMMASKKCSNLLPLDAYCGVATSSDQHDAELLPENESDSTKRKSDFEEMTSSKKQQKEKSIDADQDEGSNGLVEKEEDLKSASGIKSEKRQKESRELEEGELPEDADVVCKNYTLKGKNFMWKENFFGFDKISL